MKEIKLTRGLVALVDDEDFDYLNQFRWHCDKHYSTYYVSRTIKLKNGKQKTILMHRVIMNTPEGMEVDHKDHNGLNCQKYNIRNCTHSQNKMNVKAYGIIKYLGVDLIKKGKYRSKIKVNGITKHIGIFDNPELAAMAYDKKAKYYFGEFANLNFKEAI
jgi:hypothetical protein